MRAMAFMSICMLTLCCSCINKTQETETTCNELRSNNDQTDPAQLVRSTFDKIRAKEGKYFDHVFLILETNGGILALIEEIDSTHLDDARQAWEILSRIAQRCDQHEAEQEPKEISYWERWWVDTGHLMSIETMKSNFGSHWK